MNAAADQRFKINQREIRTRATVDCIVHGLDDFIPRACLREAREYLYTVLYDSNQALVQIDPRWDAYSDAQLAEALLNSHPYVVAHPELRTPTSPIDDPRIPTPPSGKIP